MFLTVNFHRKSLKQTGIGHYSPIAAYNSNRDIALILDVAKFKYDSYWCSVSEMYESLKPVDVTSSISRGFLIVKKKYDIEVESQGAICSLQLDHALNVSLRQSISEAGEQL
jgi:glutathione gamma-glutamylcysteinyltransferase